MKKGREVYLMYCSKIDAYKIGVSKNSRKRLSGVQTGCPYPVEITRIFESKKPFLVETAVHSMFIQYKRDCDEDNISGEWFQLPITEVINFNETCGKIEERIDFLEKSGNPFI
jgi:hypothetical protein